MRRMLFIFMLGFCLVRVSGQNWSFKDNEPKVSFSFELINHVIVIPVYINGVELSFILDTGVKETLLFGSPDSIALRNVSKVKFYGIGQDEGVEGLLSLSNNLIIADSALIDTSHNLYMIYDDSLHLSSHIGLPVNGVLGSNFFQRNIVDINYVKKVITVYKSIAHMEKNLAKFDTVDLLMERDRPFVYADIRAGNRTYTQLKMLIDLGNSDPMMLFPDRIPAFSILEPTVHEFLGKGFNGNIFGKRNRIQTVRWHNFTIKQPIVSYPDSNAYDTQRLDRMRSGSIGNQIMGRFDVIFDYQNQKLYLKRNRTFSKPFHIDMSGLEIKHDGFVWVESKVYLHAARDPNAQGTTVHFEEQRKFISRIELKPNYVINTIRINSPAAISGLRKGDILVKINNRLVQHMSLEQIKTRMQSGDQELVKIIVARNGVQMSFAFRLFDPLPL